MLLKSQAAVLTEIGHRYIFSRLPMRPTPISSLAPRRPGVDDDIRAQTRAKRCAGNVWMNYASDLGENREATQTRGPHLLESPPTSYENLILPP